MRERFAHKRPPLSSRLSANERPPPTICGDQQIRYCRICGRGSSPQSRLRDEKRSEHLMRKSRFSKTPSETAEPFFFFLFPSGFSCFFFCERRNKRNETKNTTVNDSKKNPLLGEVSRLHRDGEGLTLTDSGEPHPNRTPAFSLTPQAQRKSLAKRNAAKRVSPLRRREGVRRLHPRELLKKLDQNFP